MVCYRQEEGGAPQQWSVLQQQSLQLSVLQGGEAGHLPTLLSHQGQVIAGCLKVFVIGQSQIPDKDR